MANFHSSMSLLYASMYFFCSSNNSTETTAGYRWLTDDAINPISKYLYEKRGFRLRTVNKVQSMKAQPIFWHLFSAGDFFWHFYGPLRHTISQTRHLVMNSWQAYECNRRQCLLLTAANPIQYQHEPLWLQSDVRPTDSRKISSEQLVSVKQPHSPFPD